MKIPLVENASSNAPAHMLWAGRWIPVVRCEVEGEPAWQFSNGRDAADWLAWPPDDVVGDDSGERG